MKNTTFKIDTGEKTVNKKVKAMIKKEFPQAVKAIKKHVPGIGYVWYIKNGFKKTVAHVFTENGDVKILGKLIAVQYYKSTGLCC